MASEIEYDPAVVRDAFKNLLPKCSPLPWKVRAKYGTEIIGADGFKLADTNCVHRHENHDANEGHWASTPGAHRDMEEEEETANADMIVRAVNAHTQTVNALQAVLDHFQMRIASDALTDVEARMISLVRRAHQKATVGQ